MDAYPFLLEGLTKRYGDFIAVDGLDMAVERGSVHGFLGPNGAGKTTTLRMALSIYRPSAGRVSILGHPSALDVRERVGYLPEEKGLYKKMRADALIAYFGKLKGLDGKTARRRASELLERYGLGEWARHRCQALSKGMQQKVQVLASIVHEPELVILDEPFSGLDPVNQDVMEGVIRDMREAGRTVIFSTHVMEHAERLCDHITLIAKARKIFDGTLEEARASVPRRVRVTVAGGAEMLASLPGVAQVDRNDDADGQGSFELILDQGGCPDDVLRACIEGGVELHSFDRRDPGLRDVFIHLVGHEGAREVSA